MQTETYEIRDSRVSAWQDAYVGLRQVVGGLRSLLAPAHYQPEAPADASYSYAVWLRHLVVLRQAGLRHIPSAVVELGPGSTLGTACAAVLSGVTDFTAHEVAGRPRAEHELAVLERLAALFGRGADIPGDSRYPHLRPRLRCYRYPRTLLGADVARRLSGPRMTSLRRFLGQLPAGDTPLVAPLQLREQGLRLRYVTGPCDLQKLMHPAGHDLIFSQAMMQYVHDLDRAYQQQWRWLRPGGWVSHQIDFSCHETARTWNRHWAYSDLTWRLIKGNKPVIISRHPFSDHVASLERCGFQIRRVVCGVAQQGLARERLAPRFRSRLQHQDLSVRSALIVARRPV